MVLRNGLNIPADAITDFGQRWRVSELALFGSILRPDFGSKSDIDILVSFDRDATWSLIDLVRLEEELETLLARDVDLVERQAVEKSENYTKRKHILSTAEPLYVAG